MPLPEVIGSSRPEPTAELVSIYSSPEPTAEHASVYPSPEPTAEHEPIYPPPESEPEGFSKYPGVLAEGEPSAPTINDPATMAIMSSIAGLLSCVIIFENIIVLYVIGRKWPKQNANITYFIINLACADLISGFQFLWFNCIDVHLQMTHSGYWVLALCGLWMVTIAASIGGILNFASLRIHALKNAMKNEKFSKRRALGSIAVSWAFPILALFLPPMLGWNCVGVIADNTEIRKECSQAVFPFKKIYVLLLACLLILAMICLTAYYVSIYTLVRKRLRSVKSMSTNKRNIETEKRLFTTTVIILLLFFVCNAPVAGVMISDYLITWDCSPVIDAFQIILTLSFLNSVLNPLVYYWGMPATRDSFWLAFGARHKTRGGQNVSSVSRTREKSDASQSDMPSLKTDVPNAGTNQSDEEARPSNPT